MIPWEIWPISCAVTFACAGPRPNAWCMTTTDQSLVVVPPMSASSARFTSSVVTTRTWNRALANDSMPMKRRATAHSSCCSASAAQTSRMIANRLGKMLTTSVHQRIPLLRRS